MQKKFKSTLEGDPAGKIETAHLVLPFDTAEVWGKKRVPVRVTINGHTWRTTVANMHGCQFIGINAEVRKAAGVKAGDTVTVTLEPDTEKRDIEIPAALRTALGPQLTARLEALAFTHKKEFVRWYAEAKKDDTRARRLKRMKEMLATGKNIS